MRSDDFEEFEVVLVKPCAGQFEDRLRLDPFGDWAVAVVLRPMRVE